MWVELRGADTVLNMPFLCRTLCSWQLPGSGLLQKCSKTLETAYKSLNGSLDQFGILIEEVSQMGHTFFLSPTLLFYLFSLSNTHLMKAKKNFVKFPINASPARKSLPYITVSYLEACLFTRLLDKIYQGG